MYEKIIFSHRCRCLVFRLHITFGQCCSLECSDAQSANDQVKAPKTAGSYEKFSEKARQYEVNPDLAPTDADYAKARKDREEGKVAKRSQRTEIETIRDQNNRITEYVVTPGSTKIPYSVENRSDRPNAHPDNSKDTLGTPKFINFGF